MKKITFTFLLSLFVLSACSSPASDATPRVLGNDDAKVTLQEFSDVQCPACGYVSPQIEDFVRDNPELARLEFFHFPLSYHEYAFAGALASECAGDQGKFFEYIRTLYENQSSINNDYFYSVADSLQLNRVDFDTCLDTQKHKPKVAAHMAEGRRLGLPGTPSVYIDGQLVQWAGPDMMKQYLESL